MGFGEINIMAQKSKMGFAAMDPEQRREFAHEGGKASHRGSNGSEGRATQHGTGGGSGVGRASHHHNAAFHHESAAHHHRQAAKHHEAGNVDEADRHARTAHGHSHTAHDHSRRGFAAMDPQERRQMGRKGGMASHGGRQASNIDDDEGEANFDDEELGQENGNARSGSRRRSGSVRTGGRVSPDDDAEDEDEVIDDDDDQDDEDDDDDAARPSQRQARGSPQLSEHVEMLGSLPPVCWAGLRSCVRRRGWNRRRLSIWRAAARLSPSLRADECQAAVRCASGRGDSIVVQ